MATVTSVTAISRFNNTAKVSWSVSRNLTGVPTRRYSIKTLDENKAATNIPDIALDAPANIAVVQGLVGNNTYIFSVEMINTLGTNSAPVYSNPVTITPTSVVATFDNTASYPAGKAQATITWAPLGNYTVINTAAPHVSIPVINNNTCVITNLTGGVDCTFKVSDNYRTSKYAQLTSNSISVTTVPYSPININSDVSGTSVTITFKNIGNGGSPITEYALYYDTTLFDALTYSTLTPRTSITESFTLDNLQIGKYHYIVVAKNAKGNSIANGFPTVKKFTIR